MGATIKAMRWFRSYVFLASLLIFPALRMQPAAKEAQSSDEGMVPASQLVNGVYHNSRFGFSYRPPFGWVERTEEMRGDDASGQAKDPKAQVLLAMFERPPEAMGDTVNSAVVIASESEKSYPRLKAAVDYFGPLEEVTKAKGFQVTNQPYEFSAGGKRIAREDFSKSLGKLAIDQSTLVTLQRGYVLSFTFIGGSEDEVQGLIDGLSFAPTGSAAASSSSRRKK